MYIFVWIYNNCKLYGILACTEKRNTLNYSLFKTAHFVKLKKNRNKNRQNEPNDLNASKKTSIKEEHSNSRAVKCQNKSENISVNNTWYAYKITENHYGLETWSFPDNKKKKQPHAHTHANNGLRFFSSSMRSIKTLKSNICDVLLCETHNCAFANLFLAIASIQCSLFLCYLQIKTLMRIAILLYKERKSSYSRGGGLPQLFAS